MRKFFLSAVAILALSLNAYAQQEKKMEVRASVSALMGVLEPVAINHLHPQYSIDNVISQVYQPYEGAIWSTGNFGFDFGYSPKKWVTVTAGIYTNVYWVFTYDGLTNKKTDTSVGSLGHLLLGARFNYLTKDLFSLYGSLCAGGGVIKGRQAKGGKYDGIKFFTSYQLSPIGFTVGRDFFGFAELTAGMLGVGGLFGVGYKF